MKFDHKVDFLVMLYATCIVLSELMGAKVVPVMTLFGFHLNTSVAILTLPLIFSINDIVIEVCGYDRAKRMVRSGLIMITFIMIFSLIVTALPPTKRFAPQNDAYVSVFHQSFRMSFASLCAFIFADFTDILIFQKIRKRLGTRRLWLRNNVSNIIAQGIDTVVFMVLAFYALNTSLADNINFIAGLALPYWGVKCCMSILETPLVYAGVRWLKGGRV